MKKAPCNRYFRMLDERRQRPKERGIEKIIGEYTEHLKAIEEMQQ